MARLPLDEPDEFMPEPYIAMQNERIKAHNKFGGTAGGVEFFAWDNRKWLPILAEEFGEVAKVICEYNLGNITRETMKAHLKLELTQVGAMTAAWIDALSEIEYR